MPKKTKRKSAKKPGARNSARRKKQKRARQPAAAPKRRKQRASHSLHRTDRVAKPRKRKAAKRSAPAHAAAPKRSKRRGPSPLKGRKHTHWHKVKGHKRRTNPAIPTWAMLGLAGLAGLASYALYGAGSFAITQRLDPTMATLERNRYIAGGVASVLGLGVGLLASPIIGAGLLAGGLVSLVGTDLYLALGKVLDKAPDAKPAAQTTKGLFRQGQQQFGALAQNGQQFFGLNGLYRAGQQQFGDVWSPAYMQ